jgi:hypothetical protein
MPASSGSLPAFTIASLVKQLGRREVSKESRSSQNYLSLLITKSVAKEFELDRYFLNPGFSFLLNYILVLRGGKRLVGSLLDGSRNLYL